MHDDLHAKGCASLNVRILVTSNVQCMAMTYLMCRQIFDKLITDFEWKVFAILYEGTDSLFRTHRLLERWDAKNHGIFLYHLGTGPSYR